MSVLLGDVIILLRTEEVTLEDIPYRHVDPRLSSWNTVIVKPHSLHGLLPVCSFVIRST